MVKANQWNEMRWFKGWISRQTFLRWRQKFQKSSLYCYKVFDQSTIHIWASIITNPQIWQYWGQNHSTLPRISMKLDPRDTLDNFMIPTIPTLNRSMSDYNHKPFSARILNLKTGNWLSYLSSFVLVLQWELRGVGSHRSTSATVHEGFTKDGEKGSDLRFL